MTKKKVITVVDRRSESYDRRNHDHQNEKLFTVTGLKNSTRFRIGEMVSANCLSRLIIETDWETVIKGG